MVPCTLMYAVNQLINIPFLSLLREVKPTVVEYGFLNPSICIVIQGNKKVIIGEKSIEYGAGNYIASSIDMPIKGQVSKASPETPGVQSHGIV